MAERRDGAGLASGRRTPWGLVGMIGIVLFVESCFTQHSLDLTTPIQWDWRDRARTASRPDRVRDQQILIFGDSVLKFGMMPGVIRNLSGKPTLNFALNSGQSTSSYFLLRRALESGAKPAAIVFDATPHMFMFAPRINQQLWPEFLELAESVELSWQMRDADFFAANLLAQTLASYQYRPGIRTGVQSSLDGRGHTPRYEILVYRRNWEVNNGAQLETLNPTPVFDPDEWSQKLYPYWLPDPVNVAFLDRFLELARSHQVKVYWVLPPIHPAVQYRNEQNGFDRAYQAFVQDVQTRYPETVIVDARRANFLPEEFKDVVHLNRRGALRMSSAFADLLRDEAGPESRGSWIALDPGRARAVDLPMEDLANSAEFLRDEGRKARR